MAMLTKKPLRVRGVKKKVRFERFSLSRKDDNALCATNSENCECKNGVLQSGIGTRPQLDKYGVGIVNATLPSDCVFYPIASYDTVNGNYERYGALGNDRLYIYEPDYGEWSMFSVMGANCHALSVVDKENRPRTAFLSEKDIELFTFGEGFEGTTVEKGTAKTRISCFQQGRIFYVKDKYTIGYSAPHDPADFTEDIHKGGSLTLPWEYGEIIELLRFGGNVCIVYEEGLSLLEVAPSAVDFKVTTFASQFGKVARGSVGVCCADGEKVLFLAEQGVCAFDGKKIYAVCKNLDLAFQRVGQVCNHAAFEGKFLIEYADGEGNVCAVVIDGETGEGYTSFAPSALSEYKGGALCHYDGVVRSLHLHGDLPSGEKRWFQATQVDFGVVGGKCLEGLEMEGEGEVRVVVGNGKTEKAFVCNLQSGNASVRLNMPGEEYSIALELGDKTKIFAITAQIQQLRASA
jgi:hypothetical protein